MTTHRLIKPRRLIRGSTIGIVAPASPFNNEDFEKGLTILHDLGFQTVLASGVHVRQGYLAGDDIHRAAQFRMMWDDEGIDAVMCARGGFGSLRILSKLDFEAFLSRPKAFIGFSDITALHQQFNLGAGLVTFHGPTVCALAGSDHRTQEGLFQALTRSEPWRIAAEEPAVIRSGLAHGMLVGGNLTTLCHLMGTPYAHKYNGCVILLEDRGEAPYRIDRMLTQMKMSGIFAGVTGLALGSFENCGSREDIIRIFDDVLGGLGIPTLAGFAVGHSKRNLTIPLGVQVELDADREQLEIREPATSDESR